MEAKASTTSKKDISQEDEDEKDEKVEEVNFQ